MYFIIDLTRLYISIVSLNVKIIVCFSKDHEEIQLFPIVAPCEMKLVAAPSVVHIQQNMEVC